MVPHVTVQKHPYHSPHVVKQNRNGVMRKKSVGFSSEHRPRLVLPTRLQMNRFGKTFKEPFYSVSTKRVPNLLPCCPPHAPSNRASFCPLLSPAGPGNMWLQSANYRNPERNTNKEEHPDGIAEPQETPGEPPPAQQKSPVGRNIYLQVSSPPPSSQHTHEVAMLLTNIDMALLHCRLQLVFLHSVKSNYQKKRCFWV